MNPPLSANSPTAVLSGLAIGGHIHNSIDTIRMLLPCHALPFIVQALSLWYSSSSI